MDSYRRPERVRRPVSSYGTFDGQGHVIKGLTITGGEKQFTGLFGRISEMGATIKNLGLENINYNVVSYGLTTNKLDTIYAGGLIGTADITTSAGYGDPPSTNIFNCYNDGTVASSGNAGGICGNATAANIGKCYNKNTAASYSLSGSANAGGISAVTSIADTRVSQISACYNEGNVSASSASNAANAGGITGRHSNGNTTSGIFDCYNSGDITASSDITSNASSAGGVCGEVFARAGKPITITRCYNTGGVTVYASYAPALYAGAVCGYITSSLVTLSNSYWNSGGFQLVNGVPRPLANRIGVGGGMTDTTKRLSPTEMLMEASFAGFDFNKIWAFNAGINNSHPILQAYGVDVEGVEISLPYGSTGRLSVGETIPLTAVVSPYNATNAGVIWSSSNPGVVSVDGLGNVAGISLGAATITVITKDGKSLSSSVTVTVNEYQSADGSLTGAYINKFSTSMRSGADELIRVYIEPNEAADTKLIWTSDNPNVAEVSYNEETSTRAVVHANRAGNTFILVSTEDGRRLTGCYVDVYLEEYYATSLKLGIDSMTLVEGRSKAFSLMKFTPSNATVKQVQWSSSDESVATVLDGKLTPTLVFSNGAGLPDFTFVDKAGQPLANQSVNKLMNTSLTFISNNYLYYESDLPIDTSLVKKGETGYFSIRIKDSGGIVHNID